MTLSLSAVTHRTPQHGARTSLTERGFWGTARELRQQSQCRLETAMLHPETRAPDLNNSVTPGYLVEVGDLLNTAPKKT